ncbi:hypothetical protein [Alicyclobacillus macrosporangiidus]|uniref:hypothetical protein n=1 Tax=Alicyclobacillus macrosporangiidus TaxID=392015 RepID=UPI0015871A7E|nr:hypothetical protein [Alicyclobacillus macrosporangiidus]
MSQRQKRAVLATALLALFVGWYKTPYIIEDPIWSNLVGQWIVAHHQIPRQDYWTWTAYGQAWTPQEWGFEVLLYLANHWLGFRGVVGMMALVSSATWWTLGELLARRQAAYPRIMAFVVAVLSLPWDQIRAETFSYLLFALFVLQVERFRETGRLRNLAWLVPGMLVWANLHGSFVLGIGWVIWVGVSELIPAFEWGWIHHRPHPERSRPLLLTALVLMLVGLANPQTWHLYAFSVWLSLQSHVWQYILEWQPPVATEWYTAAALVLLGIGIVARLSALEPVSFFRSVWFVGTLAMFLHAVRFGSYFLVTLPWFLAPKASIRRLSSYPIRSWSRPLAIALALGTTGLVVRESLSVHGTLRTNAAPKLYPEAVAVVEQLHQQHPDWRLWNDYDLGGTLEELGVPVSVDGRTELYLADGVMKTFIESELAKAGTLQKLQTQGVDYVCISDSAPLVELLRVSSEWQKVYDGDDYDVFVRKEALSHA